MTHLVVTVALLLFAIFSTMIGTRLYPVLQPLWDPWPMYRKFNIAVTDFGVKEDNGRIRPSQFASNVSTFIYEQMDEAYAVADETLQSNVLIWHDRVGRDEGKNVHFGVIEGQTADERVEEAAALAERIGAHLVIYGHLLEETDPESVVLEFYYRGQVLAGEPNAMWGSYELGAPVAGSVSYRLNQEAAQATLLKRLAPRIQALVPMSQALAELLIDDPETALEIMRRAEREVAPLWDDEDGEEVLYLFLGTAAFYAGSFDEATRALEEALERNPGYLPALDMLGSVHIQRSALFQFRDNPPSPEQAACYSPEAIAASAPDKESAVADSHEAVALLERALEMAETWRWPPYIYRVRMDLGYAYQMRARWELESDTDAAERSFQAADAQFEAALEGFPAESQAIFHARTQIGLAIVDHLRAVMSQRLQGQATQAGSESEAERLQSQSVEQITDALGHYQACIDVGQSPQAAGSPFYVERILGCTCLPNQENAEQMLDAIEGSSQ